ncbi:MAG: type III-B CRISPR module RAMP protein Cmr4 [bacterium]
MSKESCFFTFYTLTPLHAGAGDSAGAIDLPVQRERHTEYPVVYSSGIKGSLRDYFERQGKPNIDEIFGKEGDDQKDSASGKVIFTDAKILLFPVRASRGVFKWVTCPFVITRLLRDLELAGITGIPLGTLGVLGYNGYVFGSNLNPIILEDFKIELKTTTSNKSLLVELVKEHFDVKTMEERLIIVSDDVFKTLVTTATQIIARNVLKENKTSENLWYEEVVPADAVFYTMMKSAYKDNDAISKLESEIAGQVLQIGGNETIGYGMVKWSNDLIPEIAPKKTQGGGK